MRQGRKTSHVSATAAEYLARPEMQIRQLLGEWQRLKLTLRLHVAATCAVLKVVARRQPLPFPAIFRRGAVLLYQLVQFGLMLDVRY